VFKVAYQELKLGIGAHSSLSSIAGRILKARGDPTID
jgi:hypothetical protein